MSGKPTGAARGSNLLPRLARWLERTLVPTATERDDSPALPAKAGALVDTPPASGLDARIVNLVKQIPAASPYELRRKLDLLAKAGTLAEVERKLGLLSTFDAYLVKMLRRIPAASHHELEDKIASLIPERERAAALAEAKEGSWRGYNAFLVDLARRIPAASPSDLENKIASLATAVEAAPYAPPRAAGTVTSDRRNIFGLFRRFVDINSIRFNRPRTDSGFSLAAILNGRAVVPEPNPAIPSISSAPRRELDVNPGEAAPQIVPANGHGVCASIPDEPFRSQPAHLQTFGLGQELVDKMQIVAGARRMIGPGIDLSFPRFVDWLRSEQYQFHGFEDRPPHFDQRCAYLRYDVHPADLLPAYVLADWHERLGIVGSFQITWKLSRDEEDAEPYFLKLLEFNQDFVQFGLHAAPTATWYLYEKLGIDAAFEGIADDEDFAEWVLDLHAAYLRDGDDAPALREVRQGTDDAFSRIAASFKATFGDWQSVSAHGNVLTKGFIKLRQRHPEIGVLQPYFYPEDYFAKWGLKRFGFLYEITSFGTDALPYPRVLYESAPEEMRREWYRGRVAHGAGFVALLHPATWTCKQNSTFFLPEEEARRAYGDGDAHHARTAL